MINNRRYVSHATGADVYALVRDAGTGNIWNTDGTPAFEAYSAANYGDYAITCTEHGASGTYEFTMPSAIPDGVYDIEFRAQDGASPAEGDTFIDAGIAAWVDGENTFRTTWNTNATELDGDPVDTLLEKTEKAQYDLISAESVGSTSILVDEAPQFPVPGDFLVFQRPGTSMALSTAVCTGAEEDGDDVRIHFLPALDVDLELTEPDTVIVMAPRSVPRTHSANAAEAGDAMALVGNAVGDAEWNVSEVLADLVKWRGTQPSTLSGTYPQVRTEAGAEIASAAQIDNLTNNTLSDLRVPKVVERPDSGTEAYVVRLHTYDLDGSMLDPDSAPTLALENAAGTDRSARLDSTTGTKVETGVYTWTYTASDTDDVPEQLVWEFTVVVSGATRKLPATSLVVDTTAVDFTSADRTKLDAVHTKLPTGDIADESTAVDAKTAAETLEARATEARLVKLDVSGTLAHSDAAAEYKATGFATPGDAMTLTSDERTALAEKILGGDWTDLAAPSADSAQVALYALRYGFTATAEGIDIYGPDGTAAFTLGAVTTDAEADPITEAKVNGE